MQNTTFIVIVPSHTVPIVSKALEANYLVSDLYVDYRGENAHVFATLSRVVSGDRELVAALKHSMMIFAFGVVEGIKAAV